MVGQARNNGTMGDTLLFHRDERDRMRLNGIKGRFKYACHGQFVGSSVRIRSNLRPFSRYFSRFWRKNVHLLTQELAHRPCSVRRAHQVDAYVSNEAQDERT